MEGNQRIETETILSYMLVQEGDLVNTENLDLSLKNLFATGLFSDVNLYHRANRLVVNVVENPIINRLAFEGNLRVRDGILSQAIQLRPRATYTRTKALTDVQNLISLYRRRGRFATTIEPKIIPKEQNRVDLVFEIKEGPATYIQRIHFTGNYQYSDSVLREVLTTQERRWYRFLSSSSTYDSDRLVYDLELLRRFYHQRGYIDFRVLSAVAELTLDRQGFLITLTIEEGERYRYGDVRVNAKAKISHRTSWLVSTRASLLEFIICKKDNWYNITEIETSTQQLLEAVGAMGYAFVDVRPRQEQNQEKHTVDVTYDIQEGPRVFIERIDINGNVRTLEKVIRRELRLAEGDAFNATQLRRSMHRIENLDFFEKVDIYNVFSETASDQTLIKVDIEEKSTGELSFGVGWSTTAGAMIEIGVRERNLLGRGQDLRTALTLGQRRAQVDLSFTEPYFLDRELVAGFDIFTVRRNLQRESSFDSNTMGGSLRIGFIYNELLHQNFHYTVKRDKIENVRILASPAIKLQEGVAIQSSIGQSITYDTRDNRIHPTGGHVIRLSNDIAGLGGTDQFVRTNLSVDQYFSFGDHFILKCSADAGHIIGLGRAVRIGQRYFLGGDNLRGFKSSGVGPRDKRSKDSLGGNWLVAGTVEVTFPLGLPEELGVKGKVFSDFGTLGQFDDLQAAQVHGSTAMRVSAGAGVTWKSPVGPLSLDMGVPLKKEPFDQTEIFRFNFGTRF